MSLILPVVDMSALTTVFMATGIRGDPMQRCLVCRVVTTKCKLVLPMVLLLYKIMGGPAIDVFKTLAYFLFLMTIVLFGKERFGRRVRGGLRMWGSSKDGTKAWDYVSWVWQVLGVVGFVGRVSIWGTLLVPGDDTFWTFAGLRVASLFF